MGIKDELDQKRSAFISIKETIEALTESEGVSVEEAASWLLGKLDDAGESAPVFVIRDKSTIRLSEAGRAGMGVIFSELSRHEKIPDSFTYPLDELSPTVHGWIRSKLVEFLATNGVGLDPSAPKPQEPEPYWLGIYRAKTRITVEEAARILCGLNPAECVPFDINDHPAWAELDAWRDAVFDAIDSGRYELDQSGWGIERGEQTINKAAFGEWAASHGFYWPLASTNKVPAPESPEGRKMAQELEAAKARIRELEKLLKQAQEAKETGRKTQEPTRLMQIAASVQERYWGSNWNPSDKDTQTPQSTIIGWLETEHGLSNAEAKSVEKVACPFDRNPAKKK